MISASLCDTPGPGFAPLWPGGDVIRRHRDHRCDCDAPQPLSALGPRTERELQKDAQSIRRAIRFNTIDSAAALTVTFFVNAAILVLAAMVFFGKESVIVSGGQVVQFHGQQRLDPGRLFDAVTVVGHSCCEHAVCCGSVGERPEQHHHQYPRRSSRDGQGPGTNDEVRRVGA